MSEDERDRNRRENLALSAADEAAWVGPKPEWWLSFVDSTMVVPKAEQRPGGRSFLGVAIVSAVSAVGAMVEARARGCNPGGQIAATGPNPPGSWDPKWMNRLLSREDLALMEEEMP